MERQHLHQTPGFKYNRYRCFRSGLGSNPSRPSPSPSPTPHGIPPLASSHQCKGMHGCCSSHKNLQLQKHSPSPFHRLNESVLVHRSMGGGQVSPNECSGETTFQNMSRQQYLPDPSLHSVRGQSSGSSISNLTVPNYGGQFTPPHYGTHTGFPVDMGVFTPLGLDGFPLQFPMCPLDFSGGGLVQSGPLPNFSGVALPPLLFNSTHPQQMGILPPTGPGSYDCPSQSSSSLVAPFYPNDLAQQANTAVPGGSTVPHFPSSAGGSDQILEGTPPVCHAQGDSSGPSQPKPPSHP